MDEAKGEKSPFRWDKFRQPFVDALAAGAGEPFCITWLDQLGEVLSPGLATRKFRSEPALADTVDSLGLLLEWWLPSRVAGSAENAAQTLRDAIEGSLFHWHQEYVWLLEDPEEPLEVIAKHEHETRLERIDELRDDPRFVARTAVRLVGYDPRTDASPSRALRDAVREELEREVGPLPSVWSPNRKSLSVELGRLFALDADAPGRVKLEECVAKLSDEEREFVQTMYGGGSSKTLEPGRWGGRRRTRVGTAAKIALIQCMPELARFAMPEVARFGAGMSVEEG